MVFFAGSSEAAKKDTPKIKNTKVENRYKSLETFARGLFYLESLYVDEDKVKEDDMVLDALSGITSHLDPHTVLMRKKDFFFLRFFL